MSEGVSYEFAVDPKLAGVEAGTKILHSAESALKDVDAATKGAEAELKQLRLTLAGLKRPDEIKRLKEEISGFSKSVHPAHEGITALGGAIEKHGEHVGHASDAWHKHHYEMEGVGKEFREARGRLLEFGEAIGAIAVYEGLEKLTDKVMEMGGEILHTAGAAERLAISLKFTAGEEGAEEVLKWIDRIASKTRYTAEELKGWSNQLLKSGVSMKDIDKFLAAGLDLNAKGGDMGTVIEAMTRANITGRIGTRQLVGLGIGVKDIATLPEYKGLDKKTLYKKIEQGSITIAQLLKLVAGEGDLGDKGVVAGRDFEARLKNLKTLPEQYYEKFAESPAFEHIKDKLSEMFTSLDPNSDRGGRIFGSLERSFTHIVDQIGKIDFEKVATSIEKDIIPAIERMVMKIGPFVDKLLMVINAAEKVNAIWGSDNNLGGAATKGRGPAHLVKDFALNPVGQIVDTLSDMSSLLFGKGADAGKALGDGVKKGVQAVSPTVLDAAAGMGKGVIDATTGVLEVHSPSKVFERIGRHVGQGFMDGIDGTRSGVDDVMRGAFAIPVIDAGPRGRGAGGGSPVHVEVHVHMGSGSSGSGNAREIGEAVGAEIKPVILQELADALERASNQQGAA